jgi:hypothetical protein
MGFPLEINIGKSSANTHGQSPFYNISAGQGRWDKYSMGWNKRKVVLE